MAQLGRVAKAATTAGSLGKAATAIAQIQKIGKMMLYFDIATLGTTAVIVSVKVSDDVQKINALDIPQSQKDVLLKQVAIDALMQGAMLAFQTVMMARTHIEAAKQKVESSRYKSLEEKEWINAEGNITSKAPPVLRQAKSTGELISGGQKPTFNVEEEFGLLFNEVKEKGKSVLSNAEPDYDAVATIKNSAGEEHSYKRRSEDGVWCRYSKNPFCFLSNKEIEDVLKPLDAFIGPPKSSRQSPKTTKGDWPTLTKDIESTMAQGAVDLRKDLGKKWLPPWLYGTKLHKKVADIFRNMKLPKGWTAIIEKPLTEFVKAGILDSKIASMKVKDYLKGTIFKKTLIDSLPEGLANKTIGQLEPDLVLISPDGKLIVWDLTPRSETEHLAKTMLYAHILSGGNRPVQIGESYYKWQSHIELDVTGQSSFQQTGPKTSSVSLKDSKILSLIKKYAGAGTQQGKLIPGVSGSEELITGNKEIIGQYYDARSGKLKDTSNFIIHYTNDGLYIEPAKP
jgi:hypothetical protein